MSRQSSEASASEKLASDCYRKSSSTSDAVGKVTRAGRSSAPWRVGVSGTHVPAAVCSVGVEIFAGALQGVWNAGNLWTPPRC